MNFANASSEKRFKSSQVIRQPFVMPRWRKWCGSLWANLKNQQAPKLKLTELLSLVLRTEKVRSSNMFYLFFSKLLIWNQLSW